MRTTEELWICRLGQVEYRAATALQEALRAARLAGALPDVLLLLEHPAVYTRGRRSDAHELPMGEAWYLGQGIDVVQTDRGGKLTYHGPGQLVGYPVMGISDVVDFLRRMERALIAALADAGVEARMRDGLTGVWVGERKIASIGVHVSRGITTHGFAVNVENDLQPFEWVVPCGLEGVRMTSVIAEAGGGQGTLAGFREHVAERFAEEHGRRATGVAPERLEAALGASVPLPA